MQPEILIIGTGPGPLSLLTREAEEELLAADKIFFRMSALPVYHWLKGLGKKLACFDTLYTIPQYSNSDIYQFIADALIHEALLRERAVYALPGHPLVFEDTTRLIKEKALEKDINVRIIAGLSFLELIYQELGIDPVNGLQVVSPAALESARAATSENLGLLIGLLGAPTVDNQRHGTGNVDTVRTCLQKRYPSDHPVTLVWTTGLPNFVTHTKTFALEQLVHECGDCKFFASLYVPPINAS